MGSLPGVGAACPADALFFSGGDELCEADSMPGSCHIAWMSSLGSIVCRLKRIFHARFILKPLRRRDNETGVIDQSSEGNDQSPGACRVACVAREKERPRMAVHWTRLAPENLVAKALDWAGTLT